MLVNLKTFLLSLILFSCSTSMFVFEKKIKLYLDYDIQKRGDKLLLTVSDPYHNLSGILKTTPFLYAFYYCMDEEREVFPIMSKEQFVADKNISGHKIVKYDFLCSAEEKDLKEHIFKKMYYICTTKIDSHPDIKELCEYIDKRYRFYAEN